MAAAAAAAATAAGGRTSLIWSLSLQFGFSPSVARPTHLAASCATAASRSGGSGQQQRQHQAPALAQAAPSHILLLTLHDPIMWTAQSAAQQAPQRAQRAPAPRC